MRIFLIVLLVLVFGYSIALVLANRIDVEVNLLFSIVPAMNLGLLLIITIALGVLLGLLLGLQVFRVFQMNWEVSRLKKELESARAQHIKAAAAAAQSHAAVANASDAVPTDPSKPLR
jgi:putative membrane protein